MAKRRKEPEILDVTACTCANLRKASRLVTQFYDAALAPAGLRATQFTLLATLSKRGGLPHSKLADALVMDRTTLTRNLKPLVDRGLIEVGAGADQRVRHIALTDEGQAVLEAALPHWRRAQARLVERLGHKPWAVFLGGLKETVQSLQEA